MKIKAAVISETGGDFNIEQLELCELNADEVLVRIIGVGICNSPVEKYYKHYLKINSVDQLSVGLLKIIQKEILMN